MSHKPAAAMSGVSLLGGITAYTRYNSFPALVASFAIGGAMAVSSMRIKDNMEGGIEGAAISSGVLMVPTLRRAVITRFAPIPVVVAGLAVASTAYYGMTWYDGHHLL